MIPDSETNLLYLADTLPKKYSDFFQRFEKVLNDCNIPFLLLPQTKDIWAVDYMPIQVQSNRYVQFVYNPDYLRKYIKWRKTISDGNAICKAINKKPEKSRILIDGGNVIRSSNKVIMCDKIFSENPEIETKELIRELQNILQADKIIFIPTDPHDEYGHADGILRFHDNETVLINDYSKKDEEFELRVHLALHNAGLKYIKIPYNPYSNEKKKDASGAYINFLQMKQAVIVPTFGLKEDETAIRKFEELYPGETISPINSNDIAVEGGILNCISWNIQYNE